MEILGFSRSGLDMGMGTVKTSSIGPCAMSLELPPLVRSGVFFFFFSMSLRGPEELTFCCVFRPFSRVGNFRRHSTWADCWSFYGMLDGLDPGSAWAWFDGLGNEGGGGFAR